MPPHTTQPPFAPGAQGQPAGQAASAPPAGKTTHAMAERHEALFLALAALHKDVIALGAKKPGATVPEGLRVTVEGLLSDCAPFARRRGERLPVAAGDMAGLAAQLGQALALLEAFESRHTVTDERFNCRMWRVAGPDLPVMRLKPPAAALQRRVDMADVRQKLAERIDGRNRAIYQEGFKAGLAARQGPPSDIPRAGGAPVPDSQADFGQGQQTYPRLRRLD